jgi:hypothetical protein
MERHRALTPLITLLAIATGVTLFATGWALASPAVADPRPYATEQVVRDFYAAVNLGIRTGDTTVLDDIVVEDGVVHGGLATLAPDRAGLTRYVNSLHATTPHLELSVVDIVSAGDRSLVDIAIEVADDRDFLGSPIADVSLWGRTDALRVSDRKVVELWSGANGMVMFEPLAQVPFPEMSSNRAVALDRLSILPGESFVAEGADESRWLYVESGQASISTTHLDWASSAWGPEPDLAEKALVAGDLLTVPTWSRAELRNRAREPATLLVVSTVLTTMASARMDPAYPQGQLTTYPGQKLPSWKAGVQEQANGEAVVKSLAGDAMMSLPIGEWSLNVARATLAPRSAVSINEATGLHVITVNDGSLELNTTVRDSDKTPRHIDAGAGALLDLGTTASLSNIEAEPVVITIIAILPAEV